MKHIPSIIITTVLLCAGNLQAQSPVVPTQLTPTNGGYSGGDVTFTWQNNSANQWVQIWLATSDSPTALISDQYGDGAWVFVQEDPNELGVQAVLKEGSKLPPGEYRWWARSWANGKMSPWSSASTFTVLAVKAISATGWQAQEPNLSTPRTQSERFVNFTPGDAVAYQPIELPDGAKIVSIEIGYDSADSGTVIRLMQSQDNFTLLNVNEATLPVGTPGLGTLNFSTPYEVDNSLYFINIEVNSLDWGDSLAGVRIFYIEP